MVKTIAHVIVEPRYSGGEILALNPVRSQLEKGTAGSVIALRDPSEVLVGTGA